MKKFGISYTFLRCNIVYGLYYPFACYTFCLTLYCTHRSVLFGFIHYELLTVLKIHLYLYIYNTTHSDKSILSLDNNIVTVREYTVHTVCITFEC